MKLRFLLPLLALLFVAAAKKKEPEVTIRFHTEVRQHGGESFVVPVMLQNPPRRTFISKVPAISERDVVAIYPFPAPDGTMGCALKLDEHGRIALDTLSVESRSSALIGIVNGRQVVEMQIDKRVSDGILTIPSGILLPEIQQLEKKFRIMGQAQKKKK